MRKSGLTSGSLAYLNKITTRVVGSDSEDRDADIFMTVLHEENKDDLKKGEGKILKDVLKDMSKGTNISTGKAPKKLKPEGPPPPKISALKRTAYDIRNFYTEDATGPESPVSIEVVLSIPSSGTEENLNELEKYVSEVLTTELNLGAEHHLVVNARTGSPQEPPVLVSLDGFDPGESQDFQDLVSGLVVQAVSQFADLKS